MSRRALAPRQPPTMSRCQQHLGHLSDEFAVPGLSGCPRARPSASHSLRFTSHPSASLLGFCGGCSHQGQEGDACHSFHSGRPTCLSPHLLVQRYCCTLQIGGRAKGSRSRSISTKSMAFITLIMDGTHIQRGKHEVPPVSFRNQGCLVCI